LSKNETFDFSLQNNNVDENENQNHWQEISDMRYRKAAVGLNYLVHKKEILLIGGISNDKESSKTFLMYDIQKNHFTEYPKCGQCHEYNPGVLISPENDNIIYDIGHMGIYTGSWGVIEYIDLRDNAKTWHEVGYLEKLFDMSETRNKRYFTAVLNSGPS